MMTDAAVIRLRQLYEQQEAHWEKLQADPFFQWCVARGVDVTSTAAIFAAWFEYEGQQQQERGAA